MNQLEARIRDFLADRLELIEPNLVLVRKEFPLANDTGAGGAIDILARDTTGHFVVIEIKRSDATARAALHELTKYVALLKSTLGIQPDRIRALLLSTDWHELALPFTEYQQVCEVPTEGFVLTAGADGTVTGIEQLTPVEANKPLTISREQFVYLYSDKARRDASVSRIAGAAKASGLEDFAILAVDYHGSGGQVIYPFGAWVVFSSPLEGMKPSDAAALKARLSWDHGLDDQDENFLVAIGERVGHDHDSGEVGYPEKLASVATNGWQIVVLHRNGRYAANHQLISDAALVADAARMEGGASQYMYRTSSPRYLPSWRRFKEGAQLVLRGNPSWAAIVRRLTGAIEKHHARATVSACFYNPADILVSLMKLFARDDPRYLPEFKLITTDADQVTNHIGMLVWDGKIVGLSGQKWIERAYGGADEYLMMSHFGQQFEKDATACELLGLRSVVVEARQGTAGDEPLVLSLVRGRVLPTPASKTKWKSVEEFQLANKSFGLSLVKYVSGFTIGL